MSPRSIQLTETTVLLGAWALLFVFFTPSLLLAVTTTTGGDTGAHIYAPWYLREHLLPLGQLFGWSPGWFTGFPMLHFYFPLVATVQALLSFVIPYEIAFKLGTVLGVFFLPIATFLMLRLMRFQFPIPVVGAIFGLYFLFMDSFQIYGGNIAGSLAGEYSFALSFGLCLVFVGLLYRLLVAKEGSPVLPAIVLAAGALSHLVPVLMALVSSVPLILWGMKKDSRAKGAVRSGTTFGLAFALTAFWSIPFLARLPYTANMHWGSLTGWGNLMPRELWLFVFLAACGGVLALVKRDARALVFGVPAAVSLLIYFFLPEGHVWNGRFISFWYFSVLLSAAYGVGIAIPVLARTVSRARAGRIAIGLTIALAMVIALFIMRDKGPSYVDNWITDNYNGYERRADFPAFRSFLDEMDKLPPGRVMWEPNSQLGKYGTPVALMSLPYWTDHASMEGMYFESGFTTPFHFLAASEVAESPSNPIPGLPYHPFDLDRGTEHMELMDVSYYVTFTKTAREAALEHDALELITHSGEFSIFEVDTPGQVIVPAFEPVVLESADWIDANIDWFTDPAALDVPLTSDGPPHWARASSSDTLPRRPQEHAGTSISVELENDSISFDTEAIGVPHWVKTSYFPNWKVTGAEGPYLASPSMMLVIPTQEHVVLSYERTWAEWLGLALTAAGLLMMIAPHARRYLKRVVQP